MRIFIIILLIVLLFTLILGSCGKKHWTSRGIKRGWIDTTAKGSITDSIIGDTAKGNNDIKDFADSVASEVEKDCPTLDSSQKIIIRDRIRTEIKEKLIPKYIRDTFKDTTIVKQGAKVRIHFTSDGKMELSIVYPKQEIKPYTASMDRFWRGFGIGAGCMLVFLLGLIYLLKMPK